MSHSYLKVYMESDFSLNSMIRYKPSGLYMGLHTTIEVYRGNGEFEHLRLSEAGKDPFSRWMFSDTNSVNECTLEEYMALGKYSCSLSHSIT